MAVICERTTSDKGILGQIKYAVEVEVVFAICFSFIIPSSVFNFFLPSWQNTSSHSLEIALHVLVYELFSFFQPLFDNLLRDSIHKLPSLPSRLASQAHPLLRRQQPLWVETFCELGQIAGQISSSSSSPLPLFGYCVERTSS